MNGRLHTVLIAPFRVPCRFGGVNGQVALDHLRSLSKARLLRQLGALEAAVGEAILTQVREMFAE